MLVNNGFLVSCFLIPLIGSAFSIGNNGPGDRNPPYQPPRSQMNEMGRGDSGRAQKRAQEEQIVQKATQMRRSEETEHASDPEDRGELARLTLQTAFEMAQARFSVVGDGGILVTKLISKYLERTSGEARYFLMKMLEWMDSDLNYKIDKDEFTNTLAEAVAYADHAVIMLFHLYDQNYDGVITKYEWVLAEMRKLDEKESILDLWRTAGIIFHERDQNKDNVIDQAEFAMYGFYDLLKSIGSDVEDKDNTILTSPEQPEKS